MTKSALTRPLPRIAMPVVQYIRMWVPRPRSAPFMDDNNFFDKPAPRWHHKFYWDEPEHGCTTENCCPMGMLPCAASPSPQDPADAGMMPFTWHSYDTAPLEWRRLDRAVNAFAEWWDDQSTPDAARAAMDVVWPPEDV